MRGRTSIGSPHEGQNRAAAGIATPHSKHVVTVTFFRDSSDRSRAGAPSPDPPTSRRSGAPFSPLHQFSIHGRPGNASPQIHPTLDHFDHGAVGDGTAVVSS